MLLVPKSYTEYHFLKKESPRMASGPIGSVRSVEGHVSDYYLTVKRT